MDPKHLKTMGMLSRAELRIAHGSSPAVADGRLYYRGRDHVRCYDLRAANALKPGESNPAVAGDAGDDEDEEEEKPRAAKPTKPEPKRPVKRPGPEPDGLLDTDLDSL
jgi:hypothetical protein